MLQTLIQENLLDQGFSNFFPDDPNFKLVRHPNRKNMNLPNLVRGVSLLSFTEFITVLGYFGHSTQHFGHSTPQVRTFMAFFVVEIFDITDFYGNFFMNFEKGFNKILNSRVF